MAGRTTTLRSLATALLVSCCDVASARSLSEQLGIFEPGAVTITPAIIELQRGLARSTDFPATTTTPGVTFRYDAASGAYVRSPGPLGPAFLERAETVGKGRLDLATSYLYARFTRFDGESLSERLSSRFVVKQGDLIIPQRVETRDFSLTSHVVYLSGTYGLGDRVDVNLLLPLRYTVMDGRRRFLVLSEPGGFESLDGDAFGPGDLLVRGKYRFLEGSSWGVATGMTVQLPTGDEDDFQGTGDTVFTPSIVASWVSPFVEVHGSFGIDANVDDLERSGVRYGVGASFAPFERLTVLVDLVGTSDFSDDDFSFFVPDPRLASIQGEFEPPIEARAVGNGTEFRSSLARLDVVDVAFGVKVNLYRDLVCFLAAIVPVTDDGARADVIPAGGIQYGF